MRGCLGVEVGMVMWTAGQGWESELGDGDGDGGGNKWWYLSRYIFPPFAITPSLLRGFLQSQFFSISNLQSPISNLNLN